ncbi:EAL domain-containing protein [Psychrosphaera aquimarina]|uniref:EAL domain-containing protein n=1 Tax=Psychrosphaera aquimarina TaxID=2044854 RepID=A0ABU3QVQ9_9GAMM|nr:EAL domain-containing protein [Psychrosphaera aquimarina]MDU0111516.1 EAL domain-containing protein [Psychrosphaera aquimarina]
MEINSASLQRNANRIYGVIVSLGILLSAFVYYSTDKIERSASILIEHEIPIFGQLQKLDSSLTEQELYLNEYYANQDSDLYSEHFKQASLNINQLLKDLQEHNVAPQQITDLSKTQKKITDLAAIFDENMQSGASGKWDTAREHLEMFSMYRQQTKPIVQSIAADTDKRVMQQYTNTKQNLAQTSYIVLAYSVLILVLATFIGRYIKSYILVSGKNKRLALFPQRNPNPIISLDKNNNLVFSNPATKKLITALNLSDDIFYQSLKNQVMTSQQHILNCKQPHRRFEFIIGGKTLDCEIHWLEDMETWDLHLSDITQRKLAEDKLNYQAYHDQSTGLYNKNKFYEILNDQCELNAHFVIGSIEVRNYSKLVSQLGIEQTGKVLQEVAELLQPLLNDIIDDYPFTFYKTSEKQFSIIIEADFCTERLHKIVHQIETKIEREAFCNAKHIELDFGFCCFPEHAKDKSSIIKCLNIALDQAIATEHSSLIIYSQSLGETISKELALTEQLRVAISNKELELYFQPQLNIQNGQIVGLETLIRWITPDGFISPAEFIPLAEKSGLIIPLGEWITINACKQAKYLIDQGYKDIVVAINISPQQFQHPNFYDMIVGALAFTQVPAKNIELEITEGVIMYNESDTIDLLHKLKAVGLMLSIDDFGTGYSSLSYLKQFPIDKLKIDQSFIFNVNTNEADKAIVSAIVDLGKNLGLTLIAEGVEELEHLNILKDMGCQEIQGYYFSRPLPVAKLHTFLQDNQDHKAFA